MHYHCPAGSNVQLYVLHLAGGHRGEQLHHPGRLHEPTPRRGHAHRRSHPAGRGAALCPHRANDADDDSGAATVDGAGDETIA